MPISTIEEGVADLRMGKALIVVDDADRENEGDLMVAAEAVTPEHINFMAKYGGGLVCMPVPGDRLDELQLPQMVTQNTARHGTPFTIPVDVKEGATTGISAFDRAATVKAILDPRTKAEDLARPGHLFPLRYTNGGVLVRAGHTEAIVDLSRLAGFYPAGVLCEIMAPDGTMARMPYLEKFAEEHGLHIVTIEDLIAYRRKHERLVERVADAKLPTRFGDFTVVAYKSMVDPDEHLALVMGEMTPDDPVLVRVHSQCTTGDIFGSLRCDCGEQMLIAWRKLRRKVAGSSCTCGKRAAASACTTRSGPMRCRTTAWTRWRPTLNWDSRRTCAGTASARRSWRTWASAGCGYSPTTPRRSSGWTPTGWTWWTGSQSSRSQIRRTVITWRPSASSWAIS